MNIEQATQLRAEIIEGAWNHMVTVTPDAAVLGDQRVWKAAFERGFTLALELMVQLGVTPAGNLERAMDAAALTSDAALMYEDVEDQRRGQAATIRSRLVQMARESLVSA